MQQKNNMNPPVSEGEHVDVKIDNIGEKGDGIARVGGFVLFIPDVKKGEHVRVKVNKVLPKMGFAEVVGRKEKALANDAKPDVAKKAKDEDEELLEKLDESKFSEDFGED